MSMPFSTKAQQLQFVNAIIGIHDIGCRCNNPAFHSYSILTKQLKNELQPEERKQIITCLGDPDTTATKDEDGFEDGELDRLFSEDAAGEDESTG